MNQFSIGLYAPLMSAALLYTTLLPLEIRLQKVKGKAIISVNELHVELRCPKQYCVFDARNQQSTTAQKHVWRHNDEIMSCVLFELIPMGKCELKYRCRSGDLYF